ncbi:zinc finger protein 84-like [Pectinophora gossypiella]|uniref:C2H2-type domain-containing protein n=1 Tax=Pectinophora gossypiella TaxID=13191 RepID=A0A1E1W228_PECGO|nr:zinc finger protein 84-like [Pectinophora gossypiella]
MSVTDVLSKVLYGKSNFCCLCFQNVGENPVYIDDVLFIASEESETMYQILETLFRDEIPDSISTFGVFCDECKTSSVNSYKFMKLCKQNSEKLSWAIQSVKESLEHTIPDFDDYKTLFVSLHLNDFTTRQFYDDNKRLNTPSNALKRFSAIINKSAQESNDLKNIFKYEDFIKTVQKEPKSSKIAISYDIPSIPTSDIVVDSTNPTDYKCKICLKKFLVPEPLRSHYFKRHYPKTVKCSNCPRKFISKEMLEIHIKQNHTAGACMECGKYFTSKYVLRKHEMNHYFTVICPDCGRTYRSKEAFKKHITDNICQQKMKKSSEQGMYQCDFCKKHYCHKPYLAKHIKYEHGNAIGFRCEFCSKQFYTKSRLETHLVKHTREKNFVCSVCDGRFVTKASLLYHTRLHTGEKPYQCEYCEKAFLSASRRLDHVRRHHLAPSLECDICHAKFKATGSLLKHRKRHLNPNSRLSNPRLYAITKGSITEGPESKPLMKSGAS